MAPTRVVTFPPWLVGRFQTMFTNPPHFEASWYGPINAILNLFFPVTEGFLVKPQPRLRPPNLDAIPVDEPLENADDEHEEMISVSINTSVDFSDLSADFSFDPSAVSYDSHGDLVGFGGDYIPDFIAVNGTSSGNDDVPLCVVEVKRPQDSMKTSQEQVSYYLERTAYKNPSPDLVALLIMGEKTFTFTLGPGTTVLRGRRPITTLGPIFKSKINKAAGF